MVLLCHVILQDHLIKVKQFYAWEHLMVSNHPAKFGGRRRCGSGDMFVVVGGQDSTCPCLDPPLLLYLKHINAMLSHTKYQDVVTLICRFSSDEGLPILATHAYKNN